MFHLEENNLLHIAQHSFTADTLTLTNMYNFNASIAEIKLCNNPYDIISFDLQKSF